MAIRDGRYTWDLPPSKTAAPPRLTVATCQISVMHDVAANTAAVLGLIEEAAGAGADVAHFPECALSGYGTADWPSWEGFSWDGLEESLDKICAAARRTGIWVVIGSAHRESAHLRPRNSVYAIDRSGHIAGRYDKRRCSMNDFRAFDPGEDELTVTIDGVACGFLICLDWAFPELWAPYAGRIELLFHSCVSDHAGRDRNHAHTIPALMQGYAFLHQFAISVSNSCRPRQDFASFWVERSGHRGLAVEIDRPGLAINALKDDPKQDGFFGMVRDFRNDATSGRLYRR